MSAPRERQEHRDDVHAPLTLQSVPGTLRRLIPMLTSMIRKKRLPLGHLALYGWLPSPLKVWAYRTFRRYKIGTGVKLAFGAVVVGESVELGDHVESGLLAMVMGRSRRGHPAPRTLPPPRRRRRASRQ